MLQVNSYCDGKVMSIGFKNENGIGTVGVMEPGEYSFDTQYQEEMIVISGMLSVQLEKEEDWKDYYSGQVFLVPPNHNFKLRVMASTAYCCYYR